MKKSLLSLAGIMVMSALVGGAVNAQLDISELFSEGTPLVNDAYSKILNEYETTWGYSDANVVVCDSNNSTVNVTSPAIQDGEYYDVPSYRLFLSPYRVSKLKEGDSSIDQSKVIIKEAVKEDGSDEIKFSVSEADGLSADQVYYGFILPINDFDVVGTPTKEICFQMANNMCLQDVACDTIAVVNTAKEGEELVERHGAADCIGMDMANVSHTVNNGTLTLKWMAVDGDTVQIAIYNPKEEMYKNLGTVKMNDKKFDYKMQWDGEQNFMLTNGCKEVYYKADAKQTSEPEKEVVPPATGPAENILYIAIAAIILYGAYVVFFRKAENK